MSELLASVTRRHALFSGLAASTIATTGFIISNSPAKGAPAIVAVDRLKAEAMINEIRQRNGSSPLENMDQLQRAARSHALTMAKKGKIAHDFGRGTRLSDRLSGVSNYSYASENVGAGYSSLESVLKGWIASRGHRRNLLNSRATHFGIGMATNSATRYLSYWALILIKHG